MKKVITGSLWVWFGLMSWCNCQLIELDLIEEQLQAGEGIRGQDILDWVNRMYVRIDPKEVYNTSEGMTDVGRMAFNVLMKAKVEARRLAEEQRLEQERKAAEGIRGQDIIDWVNKTHARTPAKRLRGKRNIDPNKVYKTSEGMTDIGCRAFEALMKK